MGTLVHLAQAKMAGWSRARLQLLVRLLSDRADLNTAADAAKLAAAQRLLEAQ